MVNTMTRKGLAIASAASLAVIGFSAPAGAAGLADKSFVSLEPTTGDNYSVVAFDGQTFSLTANEASSIDGLEDLKFLVSDTDAEVFPTAATDGVTYVDEANSAVVTEWERVDGVVTLTYGTGDPELEEGEVIQVTTAFDNGTTALSASEVVDAGYYTVTAGSATEVSFVDGKDDVAVASGAFTDSTDGALQTSNIVRDADNNSFVVDSGVQTAATDEDLVLLVESGDTVLVDVTAWVDNNDNGELDSTEYTSETRTVAFHGVADLTPSITFNPQIGVDPVATITFAEALNVEQTASADFVGAMVNTTDSQSVSESWSSTDAELTLTGNTALTVDTNITLTLSNADSEEIAEWVVGVTDFELEYFTAEVVETANAVNSTTAPAGASDQFIATVRSDESATVIVTAYNEDDEVVPGVVITVDEGDNPSIASADVYTVNGEDVSSAGAFDAFTMTTGSDGQISFVVDSIDDTTDGDDLSIDFTAEGITVGLAKDDGKDSDNEIILNFNDATFTTTISNITDGDAGNPAGFASGEGFNIAAGGFVSVETLTVDQFGVAPTDSYRIKAVSTQDGETETAFASVGNKGIAAVAIADNPDADGGEISSVLTSEVQDSTTLNYGSSTAIDTLYAAVRDQVTAEVTVSVGSDDDVSTTALVAADTNYGDSAPTVGSAIDVSATAANVNNGATIAGTPTTYSGSSDLMFVADGVYAFGSLTVWSAGDDGASTVNVYSNVAGDFDVTVATSGGSATEEITFNAAKSNVGTEIDIEIENAMPGKTMVVTGTLTDAFGNPVDSNQGGTLGTDKAALSIDYDAPGFVVGDLPTETDANGQFEFRVLLGSNDTIEGTITVTYGGEDYYIEDQGGTPAEDEDNLVVARSIGSTYGTVSAWTKNMGDGTAKVYVKYPTLGDKVRIGHQTGGSGSYETIFVQTIASESDSALTVNSNGYYIVRTIDLEDINRIRVTVGDNTEVQVRYNE